MCDPECWICSAPEPRYTVVVQVAYLDEFGLDLLPVCSLEHAVEVHAHAGLRGAALVLKTDATVLRIAPGTVL